MRFKGYVILETDLKNIDVNMDYKIEKTGFNLPRFKLGTSIWSHPGLITLYVLVPVIIISTVVYVLRKKKLKDK